MIKVFKSFPIMPAFNKIKESIYTRALELHLLHLVGEHDHSGDSHRLPKVREGPLAGNVLLSTVVTLET